MHIARTLTGSTTQDEGQERQEAKTQDCQEDKRPETLVKGNGNNMECSRLREKQGVLIANRDGGTVKGRESRKKAADYSVAFFLCLLSARFRLNSILNKTA